MVCVENTSVVVIVAADVAVVELVAALFPQTSQHPRGLSHSCDLEGQVRVSVT